ncbi:rab9 effector protein with kelch motifs-like [Strongylocentrotus purpuratus]|uniref:Rab9 effector protein with kelch motifs n=1 Tax=Strongylocentrotus purpuratus TaxID=7668 RepID=A0A7M7P9L1_STRPU|nr:rab9 effector protein with kelch motifs-like [Strongylocentrotus purpuratus]
MELHPILEKGEWLCKQNLWYVVSARGQHPSMRVGQCCCHIPSGGGGGIGKLAVIGGANPNGPFDETHLLEFDQYEWDEPELTGFTARYEHASFVAPSNPDKVLVFGGAQQDKNLNCVQILDLATKSWSMVPTSGTAPSPRTCRGSAFDGSKLYIFGGGQQGSEPVPDTKMHVYDAVTGEWTQPPSSGRIPAARHGHVMAVCNRKVYLHGGMSGSTLFDDMYEYSVDTGVWKLVKTKGDVPPGRAAHGCVSHGNKILIFGGMTQEGGASDESFIFDTRKSRWLKFKPDGPPPAPRLDHAMCLLTLPCPKQTSQPMSSRQNGAGAAVGSSSSAPSVADPSRAAEEFLTSCVDSVAEQMSGDSGEGGPGGAGAASSAVPGEATLCCVVQGGMDTQGEIFDDCLILRLDNLLL